MKSSYLSRPVKQKGLWSNAKLRNQNLNQRPKVRHYRREFHK